MQIKEASQALQVASQARLCSSFSSISTVRVLPRQAAATLKLEPIGCRAPGILCRGRSQLILECKLSDSVAVACPAARVDRQIKGL